MARTLKIFKGTTGINNKIDPVRLKYNWKTGVQELKLGVNIDIDDTGRPSRRDGHLITALTGAYHSLFCDGGECLGVTGTALKVIHADYTATGIRNVTAGARMDYCQEGNRIYYLNGFEKGYVENSVSYVWQTGNYVGPTTTKTFSDPPTGHLLTELNGRMYIAEGDYVWHSEPFTSFAQYNLAKNYILFSNRIKFLRAVDDGLYVGNEKEIFFYAGMTPKTFKKTKVANYPAIEGTAVKVPGSRIGKLDMEVNFPGEVIMLTTKEGICIAGHGGQFINLSERRLDYPSAQFGAGLYKDGKYISLLQP